MTTPFRKHPRLRSFTLVEILLVLAIMVILIGIGIAAYSEMRKSSGVGSGARQLADTLDVARQTAMASGQRARWIAYGYGSVPATPGAAMNYGGAVVKPIREQRTANGDFLWQWVLEHQAFPLDVYILSTNHTAVGGWELLPAPYTQLAKLAGAPTTNIISGVSNVFDQATGLFISNYWFVTPVTVMLLDTTSYGRGPWRTIEFNAEGRPSQTYTMVVGAGSRHLTDKAFVIVDGLTGKTRVERQ